MSTGWLEWARSATPRCTVIWTASIVLNICIAMFDTGSAWFDDEPKCRSDGRIVLPRDCNAASEFDEARTLIKCSTGGRRVIQQSQKNIYAHPGAGIFRSLPRSIPCLA
jgi:hypothetical protein